MRALNIKTKGQPGGWSLERMWMGGSGLVGARSPFERGIIIRQHMHCL